MLLVLLLFKASLLSTKCRPFEVTQKWADHEMNEMLLLGDKEEALRLNYTSLQHCREMANKPQAQIDSIKQTVLPLFEGLVRTLPDVKDIVDILKENISKWDYIIKSQ